MKISPFSLYFLLFIVLISVNVPLILVFQPASTCFNLPQPASTCFNLPQPASICCAIALRVKNLLAKLDNATK